MSAIDSIESRLDGFDAAILGTQYSLETRPVTGGSYEKTPNDKTNEFYMDRPRSKTYEVYDSADHSFELFRSSLEACRATGIKRLVVVETDNQFDGKPAAGDKYLNILNSIGIPYTYIRPNGKLENAPNAWTFAKGRSVCLLLSFPNWSCTLQNMLLGVQGDLLVESGYESDPSSLSGVLYREDLAAVTVQSLLSLDWSMNHVLSVGCTGPTSTQKVEAISKEWCVNSNRLKSLLENI